MNYIGSKNKLIPFIMENVQNVVGSDLSKLIFCDLFAGTGIVGRNFKPLVNKVISNDLEYYSYVLNRNYIGNHLPIPGDNDLLQELNRIEPLEGFIYKNYCSGDKAERQYFSDKNGKKIDAIREQIELWMKKDYYSQNLLLNYKNH
jgi:adenine-specific DNA-methyltransferase